MLFEAVKSQLTRLRGKSRCQQLAGRSRRRRASVVVVLVLVAASCSSEGDGSTAAEAEDQVTTTAAVTTTTQDPLSGLRVVSYPAFGGVRFGIEEHVLFASEGDYFSLFDGPDGRVVVARVSQAGGDLQITTVDDFLAETDAAIGAAVNVTSETMSLFGAELTMHEFRDGGQPPGPGVFSGRPIGYTSNVWWTPGPLADLFLGETGGGVIAVGVVANTADGLKATRSLLDDLLPTLSLTTTDRSPSPLPSRGEVYQVHGDPLDLVPAALNPDGAPELRDAFMPLDQGTYRLGNLSVPIELEIDLGWFVAVNFPTFAVFLELPPVGPGFRDIVFQQGVNAIAGVDVGPSSNTELVEIVDIGGFVNDPPAQLLITDIDPDASIGGLSAVRFDLQIRPDATCQQDDPCQFIFTSPNPSFTTTLNAGAIHRSWWIDDVPAGPLVITASTAAADAAWLDTRAASFVGGVEFEENFVPLLQGLPDGMPSEYSGGVVRPGTAGIPFEDISGGRLAVLGGELVADDGTVAEVVYRLPYVEIRSDPVECGGEVRGEPFSTDNDRATPGSRVSIDGWGSASVVFDRTVASFLSFGEGAQCTENFGTWLGTSGLLDGRTGTIRRLQVDLAETLTLE